MPLTFSDFMGSVVSDAFFVMGGFVKTGKYRPYKTLFVLVSDVDDALFIFQIF